MSGYDARLRNEFLQLFGYLQDRLHPVVDEVGLSVASKLAQEGILDDCGIAARRCGF